VNGDNANRHGAEQAHHYPRKNRNSLVHVRRALCRILRRSAMPL
jgi:hypothetical protein